MHILEKIDPKFRLLVDRLFFTDRSDLDFVLLQQFLTHKDDNFEYFCDRLSRSMEIFWEESFWINRFEFILSTNIKDSEIENLLLSKFRSLLVSRGTANINHDNVYRQIVAWAKVKNSKKDNIMPIKDFLLGLPQYLQVGHAISVVNNFIPFIFADLDEYVLSLSKNIGKSARNFEIIKQLEINGFNLNKGPIFTLANDLLNKRALNKSNRRSFFYLIADSDILLNIKQNYTIDSRSRLIDLIKRCDFKEIEENHLRNIKNLIELDPSIADELIVIYADSLYSRGIGNKKANVDRLIRICKTFPQFSTKKVLVYLSGHNRMSDIKHWLSKFPELSKLAAFA